MDNSRKPTKWEMVKLLPKAVWDMWEYAFFGRSALQKFLYLCIMLISLPFGAVFGNDSSLWMRLLAAGIWLYGWILFMPAFMYGFVVRERVRRREALRDPNVIALDGKRGGNGNEK